MKDAAILVTSLLQFQLEGFAPQIKKASRLRKTMDGQTTTFSGVDRNSGDGMGVQILQIIAEFRFESA